MTAKQANPKNIKTADIVVGIPSYNESDTISYVVKQVDAGLQKYFPNKKAVIINVDNNSPDGTKNVFLKTPTKTAKIYISTPKNVLGKGSNLGNLFKKIIKLNAKAAMVTDADIKSITPKWVKCLLSPVLNGYDFVLPVYRRDKYDGSITNNICYPLIYGLLGINIRQPIGGDMGFSSKLCHYWLKEKWDKSVSNYGIDIFMTTRAIKGNFKICQSDLGAKIHKPSMPKLGPMFLQVTETLFKFFAQNKNLWRKKLKEKEIPILCHTEKIAQPPKLSLDYKEIEEKAICEFSLHYKTLKECLNKDTYQKLEKMFLLKKQPQITLQLWTKILYNILYCYQFSTKKRTLIKALRPLYFSRMISFIKETKGKSRKESERLIQQQARMFYKNRNYLLRKKLSSK